jgi:hypothetical protein
MAKLLLKKALAVPTFLLAMVALPVTLGAD